MENIVAELEKLCRKFAKTADPIRKAELNAEIERLSWLIEEGVCE